MTYSGKFLRHHTPRLYFALIQFKQWIKTTIHRPSIYITDSLGGSFKSYFLKNNGPLAIARLKYGMDEESKVLVETLIHRFLFYPDESHKRATPSTLPIIGGLLPVELPKNKALISKKMASLTTQVKLPKKNLDESVFYFYHGLSELPSSVHNYIKNQNFIDIGAFIGDSAIALNKYSYSEIFSLEISKKSIQIYKQNLKFNNIQPDRYTILNIGVAATNNEAPFKFFDTGSAGLSLYRVKGQYDEIVVERKTLDWIVKKYSIKPKFIKADIEGAAMDLVLGGLKTIQTHRPVLSIAVYHNPVEFFEVKPYLAQLLPDYTFKLRKMDSGVQNNLIHSEVVLVAYPSELAQ